MKTVGIIELIADKAIQPWERIDYWIVKKQYVAITPQAIAVWCRQMGHQVHYATYHGVGDPKAKLPDNLDVVFISAHTNVSALAYALSRAYQLDGTRTVIGGPHAKCFPQDCLRYFDTVVLECDKALIAAVIEDQFDPGSVISSARSYEEIPSLEERLPEIKSSSFINGKPYPGTIIALLTSVGCPYTCNFCVDWNNRYRLLHSDRLAEDLLYASRNFPGVTLTFHDPNFGVRFDETLSVFEQLPADQRNPYIIESSLKLLNRDRLKRLQDTNCFAAMPGIESWKEYSNKAGVGNAVGHEKLAQVVDHVCTLHEYIPYLQVNFIQGLDSDIGDEPFQLTKEFVRRTPFAWPYLNIPIAFGGTPLFDTFLEEGRILRSMPFTFYTMPYLTLRLKNYDPISYFEKMIDLHELVTSREMLKERLRSNTSRSVKIAHFYRTYTARRRLAVFRETLARLKSDPGYLAFHTGKTEQLPSVYVDLYKRKLGKYAELMPIEESAPVLSSKQVTPIIVGLQALSAQQRVKESVVAP
ncbi:MAG: radical SAM protein [Chloroflexi bacterium]|nr:radical SAM protein [Chloroflexota bacterium]